MKLQEQKEEELKACEAMLRDDVLMRANVTSTHDNMNTAQAALNVHTLCRICAEAGEHMEEIFGAAQLHTKINLCLPIKVCESDSLPLSLCHSCVTRLENSFELATQSQRSDVILRDLQQRQNEEQRQIQVQQQNEDQKHQPCDPIEHKVAMSKISAVNSPVSNMVLSQTSCHNSPNSSTSSEHENNAVKNYNLKPLSVQLTRLSQNFIDSFTVKVEQDVSESSQEQMRNDVANLQDIKLEPQFSNTNENDLMEENHRAAGFDVRIKTEADESCSNLHHLPIDNEILQDEDQLQNEITSELIIKPEHEWSDVEESRDNNADSEGGNYIQDLISGATENKTSPADFQEKRKKIAKNVKFCAHCEFTTHSKRTLRNHIQAHVKSECEIGCQVDADHLTCAVSSCACQICGRVFHRKANLTRHLKLHENNDEINDMGLYECEKKGFDKQCDFLYHKENILNVQHKCLQCSKEFKSVNSLKRHVKRVHEAVRSFHCTHNQCSKSFKLHENLKKHLLVHSNIRAFKCDKCSSSFKLKFNLLKHNKSVHSEVKPFECKKCSKAFKSKFELLSHGKVHSDVRPFACEVCGKMFKSKQEVKIHMNVHNMKLNFKCEQCDKKFKSQHHLYVHNKRVHVVVGRKFHCTLCDMKFKTKAHLSRHVMSVHSDVRPFSCDICAKSFKSKRNLNAHSVVHKASYDFKCTLCAAKFKLKGNLEKHMKCVHSDARPFKCNECDRSFKTKQHIKYHIARHLNLVQFKCDKCDSSFNSAGELKSHSAVHSDIFAFKCHVCERKFKRKGDMKDHIFRLHM